MSDAQKILDMIENVSPDDTDTLDEIDARVDRWLKILWIERQKTNNIRESVAEACADLARAGREISKYTRSRDALKSIRPNNYTISGAHQHIEMTKDAWMAVNKFRGFCVKADVSGYVNPYWHGLEVYLPTEELAELHAIIQAIEYERQNSPEQC